MFSAVKCWDPGELAPESISRISSEIGLPATIVEREIIFYDTLELLSKWSPAPIVLKGGTLISRLYSERKRFSWDIDLSSFLTDKRRYDFTALNSKLKKIRRAEEIMVGKYGVWLGLIERDVEKDVFADILSIKRDMATNSLGIYLPSYLRKIGAPLEELSSDLIRLRERVGNLPFIDSVRATIYFGEVENESAFQHSQIPCLIEEALKPRATAGILVYPAEYCLVEKLSRLAKPMEELSLRDALCDFYDIGQLVERATKEELLIGRYRRLSAARRMPDITILKRRLKASQALVKANMNLFKKRTEFALAKDYDWVSYYRSTSENIEDVLSRLEKAL